MSERDPAVELLALLEELERRVLAEPVLAAEYQEACRGFPAPTGDEHAELRFREWFLLEHAPSALGAPPVMAWSPAQPEPGSTWEALLGARFGIMQPSGEDGAARELWTGRRVNLSIAAPAGAEDLLMVGWFAPLGDALEIPLPGARALVVPSLAEALERDLAQARIEQPRGRLSQHACEAMLLALASGTIAPEGEAGGAAGAAGIGATVPGEPVDLEAELEALLQTQPGWDAERALRILEQHGDAGLLDELAFHSKADLDAARRLLLLWRETNDPQALGEAPRTLGDAASTTQEAAPASVDRPADADTVAAALETFDGSAGDASVAERFAALERALGLEEGTSEEIAPLAKDAEEMGPPALPGMPVWIATWAWEAEQDGAPPREPELRALAELTDFLKLSRDGVVDAQEVTRADVTAFLMSSREAGQLEARRDGVLRFLHWLEVEQQALLEGLADALEGELGTRLEAAVHTNAELSGAAADATAVISATAPLAVESEDGQAVPVQGLPKVAAEQCREGDRLLGHWSGGVFQAAAWMPQELLPAQGDG